MPNIKIPIYNQNDLPALYENAFTELHAVKAQLSATPHGQNLAEVENLNGQVLRLKRERDFHKLRSEELTAENTSLKENAAKIMVKLENFDQEVCARLVKFGIRKEALSIPKDLEQTANGEPKLSFEERCLIANGKSHLAPNLNR